MAGPRQDDELVQSEIFGPVITVQSYRGDDEGARDGQRRASRA